MIINEVLRRQRMRVHDKSFFHASHMLAQNPVEICPLEKTIDSGQ